MVQFSLGSPGRFLNKEWHQTRYEARTETYGLSEWGDIDIERYDLDNVEFTRKHKDSSYITRVQVESEGAAQGGKNWADDIVDGK